MCDNCIKVMDDHLFVASSRLRENLIKEEQKLITFMENCCNYFTEDKNENHNCKETQDFILANSKLKKFETKPIKKAEKRKHN